MGQETKTCVDHYARSLTASTLQCGREPTNKGAAHTDWLYNITIKICANAASNVVMKFSNEFLEIRPSYPRYGLSCCDNIVLCASAADIHVHCLVFVSCRQRTSHYIDTTFFSYVFVCNTSEKEQIQHKIKVYILPSQGTVVTVHTTKGRFTHSMPCPCRSPAIPFC